MKSYIVLLFVTAFSSKALAQRKDIDTKIIIEVSDTTAFRQKVGEAFARREFLFKPSVNPDSIHTFEQELRKLPARAVFHAAFKGNTVTLWGFYGMKNQANFSYEKWPKINQPIVYYKASKTWKYLMAIAREIGNNITYSN